MVAPNSPQQRANDKIKPLITPGIAIGSEMVRNTFQRFAPNVFAAFSIIGSTISKAAFTERTNKGSETTNAAITAAQNVNAMPFVPSKAQSGLSKPDFPKTNNNK